MAKAATPPALVCERTGLDEVTIVYSSPRKMCALARGISRGVAQHYGETVTINEEACMHHGAASCRIRVAKV